MDGQVLRNAGIINADAIIIGNAHDADPKDVSQPPQKYLHNVETHSQCPQTFLSLDFQCRDEFLYETRCFGIQKSSCSPTLCVKPLI